MCKLSVLTFSFGLAIMPILLLGDTGAYILEVLSNA